MDGKLSWLLLLWSSSELSQEFLSIRNVHFLHMQLISIQNIRFSPLMFSTSWNKSRWFHIQTKFYKCHFHCQKTILPRFQDCHDSSPVFKCWNQSGKALHGRECNRLDRVWNHWYMWKVCRMCGNIVMRNYRTSFQDKNFEVLLILPFRYLLLKNRQWK